MKKLLFTEMRVLVSDNQSEKVNTISQDSIKLALVDQENVRALGYNLKNESVAKLAADYESNPNMTPLYKYIQEYTPEIKASPMYPNFPAQVKNMSELEFRVNQFLHYASTYGIESVFGIEVKTGFSPKTEEIIVRLEDEQLIALKTLDYMSEIDAVKLVIENLIGRKERLENRNLELAKIVVSMKNRPAIQEIPFKENIVALFSETLLKGSVEEVYSAECELKNILKHPGDVLDLVERTVVLNKYKHLRTTTKRVFVNLLENFTADALEENLASNRWSSAFLGKNKKRRSRNRNISLIDYLSISRFARKQSTLDLVSALKNGELISWNQNLESVMKEDIMKAAEIAKQRPGIYFRMVNRFAKLGLDVGTLKNHMLEVGGDLKTQSIVSTLNRYDGSRNEDKSIADGVREAFLNALVANLSNKKIEAIAGKKVFIDSSQFDLDASRIELNDKSVEGGYIQSGLAIKIPEEVETMRFFTYWNDKKRVDIDLHSSFLRKDGSQGHIGYYGSYNTEGFAFSGDITHSDAAEYVDMNFKEAIEDGVAAIQFNINSFTRQPFKDIDTVFTGMMAIGKLDEKVELYSPKNCFFSHELKNEETSLNYAYIDIEKRILFIIGTAETGLNDLNLEAQERKLSVQSYLNILLATQKATMVTNVEDADVVLGIEKSDDKNYYSLIDENFFMGE